MKWQVKRLMPRCVWGVTVLRPPVRDALDEYRDLRKVTERVGVLLSDASAEHIEAVGKCLPIDLMRALPRRMLRGVGCLRSSLT